MDKQYIDEEMMVMHNSAEYLFKKGLIDSARMKEFDDDCLVHKPASPSTASGSPKHNPSPAFAHSRR
ncbi:hypothetical protein AGMMS49546_23390 [Spirochaetia bacterium]|nr:hypothetical protein AGMMS49546_23390 [Spirochaetia bacterium]